MLIICPDCETSYEVEAAELPAGGRKVRCTECGAVWRADAGPDEAGERLEPETDNAVETVAAPGRPEPGEPGDPVEDLSFEEPKRRPQTTKRPARRVTPKPRLMQIMAAAGLAALAALGVWRNKVVEVVPDLAGLYAAAGLPVNLRGLEFRDMTTVETMENGVPQLVVRGTIANVTAEPASVPRLRLAVRSTSGREIFVWTAMPGRNEIKGGEALPFFAQLASPPAEGREVAVRFVSARDAQGTR